MKLRINKNERGQATVEFALFGTMLIVLTLVAYDLASNISKSQSIASSAREAARVFVAKDGLQAAFGPNELPNSAAFLASKRIATQMIAPRDIEIDPDGTATFNEPDASDNTSWGLILSIITLEDHDENAKTPEVFVVNSAQAYPAYVDSSDTTRNVPICKNKDFRTRIIPSDDYTDFKGDPVYPFVVDNSDELGLDPIIMQKGQVMVAVEMFYAPEFLTGLDSLINLANFNQMYEIAFY
ncbi:MAG: TadE family protein [Verrucomicrobiota bacterium]